MSDSTYGIQAIQNRVYQLIGDIKLPINDTDVYDLDDILERKFGVGYISHPKLYQLATLNSITTKNYLNGLEERKLFDKSDYKPIELSTNRKVRIISALVSLLIKNNLQVERMSTAARIKEALSDPRVQTLIGLLGLLIGVLEFL